jgi:hypothetical protein
MRTAAALVSVMGLAMDQLTTWAERIPSTFAKSFKPTSFPRIPAGATSAMYTGDKPDVSPIATPPAIRHATNAEKVVAKPMQSEDKMKINAAMSRDGFRPSDSLSTPERIDPIRHPRRAQLMAQPCDDAEVRWK